MTTIHEVVRRAEKNYVYDTVRLGDYVDWSMHETIERIIAYLNSKHITGDKDSLGREKPFFNIVTAASNIWYRATDVDRKDITIRPVKGGSVMLAFIATVLLQDWMRRTNFGVFLNQWGRMLAQFGSAVTKFVVKEGKLIPSVVSWNRMICDQIDFDALPRIEKIYKTPAQLRNSKEYNQTVVEELITSVSARKTLQGQKKDNQNEFIELYEVHGELPVGLLLENPENEDWTKYTQQMHIVSYVKTGKTFDDFSLFSGKEAQDPYQLTHLMEEDGRTLSIGSVEMLFDPQWMQNHSQKNIKDTLDLASKIFLQTADANFLGRNVLTSVETGDIFVHKLNEPLTQINVSKFDITNLQNFANQWRVLGQELSATPDAMRGINPPSGTPLGTTQILTGQASSLFEQMLENKGLALEEILRKFIIPHIKTKMDSKEEISAILEDYQIKQIDSVYIPNKAKKLYNEIVQEQILNGEIPLAFDQEIAEAEVREGMAGLGNRRFISPAGGAKTWKEVLKDLEWEFEVGIVNEPADKTAILQTLSSTLQIIAGFAGRPMSEDERLVFNKIMNYAGAVSPIELSGQSASAPVAEPKTEALATLSETK